jgi:hypothetical protein
MLPMLFFNRFTASSASQGSNAGRNRQAKNFLAHNAQKMDNKENKTWADLPDLASRNILRAAPDGHGPAIKRKK